MVDRSCSVCGHAHGRPELPGLGLHASVTHSGFLVGVALTRLGPVGLDVEAIRQIDVPAVQASVLNDNEDAVDVRSFLRYWTRKESVVKATGDGVLVPLTDVWVSRPTESARLIRYPGRTPPALIRDLAPVEGYVGAVTVLCDDEVTVVEHISV